MRGLWWLLALAVLVTGAAGFYMIHLVVEARKKPTIGDGHDPATYGFALSPLRVPAASIQASGLPRNALETLDFPGRYGAERATGYRGRDKYVVTHDLVIGVALGGEAMAYPIQILNWHEVVNDTLAGVPILVTWSPLTATAAAFDRRVAGEALEFGFSGLLCNTHSLVYDRRGPMIRSAPGSSPGEAFGGQPGAGGGAETNRQGDGSTAGVVTSPDNGGASAVESLWSPLLGAAIAGPAAARGDRLVPVPVQLVPWNVWFANHPRTRVLARNDAKIIVYARSPYGEYYGNDLLRFPTEPLPPDPELRPYKTRVVAVRTQEAWVVYDLGRLRAAAGPRGIWETRQDDVDLRFTLFDGDPPTAWVEAASGATPEVRPTMWFAWYSLRPDDPIR